MAMGRYPQCMVWERCEAGREPSMMLLLAGKLC